MDAYLGQWGDPIPDKLHHWNGDYIISYLSRWIIPGDLISRANTAAINFHPASPDFPGIGCNNFALYHNAESYGVTCHHMDATVDTGKIIASKKFPIFATDNVESLLYRTYDFQLILFYEVMEYIIYNRSLPESDMIWSRKPFKRSEFNALFEITFDMSIEEIQRRIRAVSFLSYQPYIEINGHRFKYSLDK